MNFTDCRNKWNKRFLNMAALVASWSKDPSTQCGAVITDKQKRIVSVGFNGFPAGTNDDESIYQDRERKYRRVLHGEKNALLFARQDLTGCSIYVWPMPPCSQCAAAIVQAGIKRVVTLEGSIEQNSRWSDDFLEAKQIFEEARVDFVVLDNEIIENKRVQMSAINRKQMHKYVDGNVCPRCKKPKIVTGFHNEAEVTEWGAYRDTRCNHCGTVWREIYDLVEIKEVQI